MLPSTTTTTPNMIRLNIFQNGTFPQNGKVLLWHQNDNNHNSDNEQQQLNMLFKEIETLFHLDCPPPHKLFTWKGAQITSPTQLLPDDLLVFTTEKFEPVQPPFLYTFAHDAVGKEQEPPSFKVHVKWYSSQTRQMETVECTIATKRDTIGELKMQLPKRMSSVHILPSELVMIHRGVELSDNCHLSSLLTTMEHEKDEQEKDEKKNSSDQVLTLFCICKPFTIRVLTPSNRKLVLTLEWQEASSVTIARLKEMIYEQESVESCQRMKLYLPGGSSSGSSSSGGGDRNDKQLANDETVGSCGLMNQSDRFLHLKYSVF